MANQTETDRQWVLNNIGLSVNLELLQKVKAVILEEPKRFNMSEWGIQYDSDIVVKDRNKWLPQCGTVACLAGWTKIIATNASIEDRRGLFFINAEHMARSALNLDSDALFFDRRWPVDFFNRYRNAGSVNERVLVAAELIDLITEVVTKERQVNYTCGGSRDDFRRINH